jgi:D-alanyl-D-alanine carboxypeptidase
MKKEALEKSLDYIKDWLRFQHERGDIPGLAVAVGIDGKIVFNEPYGYADLEKKEKLTTNNLFRIASHSKTFTATALMQLQEQEKLRIDDKVVKHLPWLNGHKDKRWQEVTLRQLMSHGAGVIRDGLDQNYWQLHCPFPDTAKFKNEMLDTDLVLENNVKMKYSNYGYSLLGMIIEVVSGQPYNEYVTENIVNVLDMKNTGPEYIKTIDSRLVTGYSRPEINRKRLPIVHIDTRAMSPATGFYSNGEDLIKYFSAHIVASEKLLDDESKKEMQRMHWKAKNTGEEEEYGLGLEIEHLDKKDLLGHGGGFPGHSTKSYFEPKDKLVVIVLTNGMASYPANIGKSIIKIINYFQEHWDSKSSKFDKYEGRFMSHWAVLDAVSIGDKLTIAYPRSNEPFQQPEILEHVKGDVFKIGETDSFSSEGELVEFKIQQNKVESVIYAGEKLLPEKIYMKQLSAKNKIGYEKLD